MVNTRRAAGIEAIVALVRRGMAVREIGASLGLTGQAVHARLKVAGLSVGDLRPAACASCGAPLSAARRAPGRRHVCGRPECLAESERIARERARENRPYARCAHCGKEMRYYATEESHRPRFCGKGPCAAAYIRWRRRGEHGTPSNR